MYIENKRVGKGEEGKLLSIRVLAWQIERWSTDFNWEPKSQEFETVTGKLIEVNCRVAYVNWSLLGE
jgi:hypothetical protein